MQSQLECFGEPLSACWCKSASKGCVSHREQAPGGMWSPSGHVPSDFNPLLEAESTTWRRVTNKELPSPCLGEQCFHAGSTEEAQWPRPALALLQDPVPGRERSWSRPDAVQEVGADVVPWVSKAKRQPGKVGRSSNRGKRGAEGCVSNGRQRCAERSPAPAQDGAGRHQRKCIKTQPKPSHSNSSIQRAAVKKKCSPRL